MAWDKTKPAGDDNASSMMTGVLANWSAIQTVLSSTSLNNNTYYPDYFPVGTMCWFYKNTAPSGWTIVADVGDTLLAVKGGSTYTGGESSYGTWQQSGHALTVNEIPAHTHTYDLAIVENKRRTDGNPVVIDLVAGTATEETGEGEAHNHGSSWRPLSRVGIICSKDVHTTP